MIKNVVILAVYYPDYFSKVIRTIKKVFKDNFELVIVDNNGFLDSKHLSDDYDVVSGSNVGGEFSAWDEGLRYHKERSNFDTVTSNYIFINDTFCHHRIYTFLDVFLYKKAIKRLSVEKGAIVGEINGVNKCFVVNDCNMKHWISSYFFAVNGDNLEKILPFYRKNNFNIDNNIVTVDCFSNNLNEHLSDWLFSGNGWYGSNFDKVKIKFKLNAIINEKLLSSRAINNNLVLTDIYGQFIPRRYNSIRNYIYKIKNKK